MSSYNNIGSFGHYSDSRNYKLSSRLKKKTCSIALKESGEE